MLSRRALRVKVMQVLYALEMHTSDKTGLIHKQLKQRVQRAEDLYYTYMLYLKEICEFALVESAKRSSKFIKSSEDVNFNTDIATNSVLVFFKDDAFFKEIIQSRSLSGLVDPKIVRDLFLQLITSNKYKVYIGNNNRSDIDEVEILRYIIKKVIGASEVLDDYLEEHFINLTDDHFLTLQSMQKKLKDFNPNDVEAFLNDFLLKNNQEDDFNFAEDLLLKVSDQNDALEDIMEPRLKNWDLDRIALIDTILIKMAITEMKYFPSIPIKVTLNEYIDISKEYSTPKSKDFINGILDKIMKDLQARGEIKKIGRGLINK